MAPRLDVDEEYLFGLVSKSFARADPAPRHDYGHLAGDPRAAVLESWRFPWVDAWFDPTDPTQRFNAVTFVHAAPDQQPGGEVLLAGSFGDLHTPSKLVPLADTHYATLTLKIPKGEVHTYRMKIAGVWQPDPINPQRVSLDNGAVWSRMFTWGATKRVVLERWEAKLIERLASHILPFRTPDGETFFSRVHDAQGPANRPAHAYRLDESVGAVNYLDKLLAREEAHHLVDYRICLELIDQLLRTRNPVTEPTRLPREMYAELYMQMASGNVPGWNYGRYGNPRYFLQLLRRHVLTGAFSHPRYGGNPMALGWKYLEERYRGADGATLFDWARSFELPLGRNPAYRG